MSPTWRKNLIPWRVFFPSLLSHTKTMSEPLFILVLRPVIKTTYLPTYLHIYTTTFIHCLFCLCRAFISTPPCTKYALPWATMHVKCCYPPPADPHFFPESNYKSGCPDEFDNLFQPDICLYSQINQAASELAKSKSLQLVKTPFRFLHLGFLHLPALFWFSHEDFISLCRHPKTTASKEKWI